MEYHYPFAVCIAFVSCFAVGALFLLWRYEGARGAGSRRNDVVADDPSVVGILPAGRLSRAELWSACGGAVSPNWLLLFRALCFAYLLPVLVFNVLLKNVMVFFFYTEWTFTLLIVYFALAFRQSLLHYLETRSAAAHPESAVGLLNEDLEAVSDGGGVGKGVSDDCDSAPSLPFARGREVQEGAGVAGYVTQCVFQTVLPAAILTDLVYWGLLVPIFLPANFHHSFIDINMHAVNLVLLALEFCLNSLRFPWFRISYFILWSSAYCFLQWSLFSSGITRFWPYPFMNVDTPYAPAWYFSIIVFHGICYAICLLLALGKQSIWSRFNLPVVGK
ncbi:hypothetical protein KC19_2G246600 [Ceratodon purpureus]|uniref:Uncharacterized protein n=1 Tax=Ceratodon purpureus TaxID=3225 RepID=A0A8T0J0E3_CERPU|nr:hypothetical protein KC19_2G246600 [Ceratodon purpureus]